VIGEKGGDVLTREKIHTVKAERTSETPTYVEKSNEGARFEKRGLLIPI